MATAKLALLESRLEALEAQVQQLKEQKATVSPSSGAPAEDWVDKMYGLFADYPDFDQVVALGRKYRESLRPKPTRRKAKKAVKNRKG